jgi:hypothetical protein
VGPTAPYLTGVTPNAVAQTVGGPITVTIAGTNTNFHTGETVTVPSAMLAVSNVVVNSAGPQALVVTTGGQNLTLPLAIKVGRADASGQSLCHLGSLICRFLGVQA